MHELSIALSIVDVAEEAAERQDGRVTAVHLRLGPLAGVIKDALISAYEMARAGTRLEAAELAVEEVPLRGYCPRCAATQELPSVLELCCPVCGTPTPEVVSGRELEVVALEVES
jgi:hydrogenase nickel incorporation protein HypA/HybF